MINVRKNRIVEVITSLMLLVFLYTAVTKLWEHSIFRDVLQQSPLFQNVATPVAWLLPAAELFVCILLFLPHLRCRGLALSFVLMLLFTGYLLGMLLFHTDLPCACGGVIAKMTWSQHLAFNIIITVLSGVGWQLARSSDKPVAITPGNGLRKLLPAGKAEHL